jgi:hypothetical protein
MSAAPADEFVGTGPVNRRVRDLRRRRILRLRADRRRAGWSFVPAVFVMDRTVAVGIYEIWT